MKSKDQIVANWLPRYTGIPLDGWGKYVLLTNFSNYVHMFAAWNNVEVQGTDRPMMSAHAGGISIINFGMGGLFANYKEKNPIRVSSSQGASLTFLISILYMLFLVVLLFKPFSELFLSIMIKRDFNLLRLFYFTLPMVLISGFVVAVFYKAAVSSLRRDF